MDNQNDDIVNQAGMAWYTPWRDELEGVEHREDSDGATDGLALLVILLLPFLPFVIFALILSGIFGLLNDGSSQMGEDY